MRFGDYIKDIRQLNNWTQVEAAKQIGVEQSYLSKLEAGKSYPSEDVFSSLLAAYKIDMKAMQDSLFPAELDQLREMREVRTTILEGEKTTRDRTQRWLVGGIASLMIGGACLGAALLAKETQITSYLYKAETIIPEGAEPDEERPIEERFGSIQDYRGVVYREPTEGGKLLWRFYGTSEETRASPLRWFMVPATMFLAGGIGCGFASVRSR
ncbi:MAG: helix-turn-helix transcriptional regulator [Pseudomonadota bacterium]